MTVIVEEDVQKWLAITLAHAAALIERIDPTQRLTRLAITARIEGAGYRSRERRVSRFVEEATTFSSRTRPSRT